MPRLTEDQWAAIRIEWEGEPRVTMTELAERFGVNKSALSRKAKNEGWQKRGQLPSINEAAQRKADARFDVDGNSTSTQREGTAVDLASRSESEDVRAAVLVRHRSEWSELELYRRHALEAMDKAKTEGNREEWTIAKTAAETAKSNLSALQIKQDGERKAWGMDDAAIRIDVSKASDEELERMAKGKA